MPTRFSLRLTCLAVALAIGSQLLAAPVSARPAPTDPLHPAAGVVNLAPANWHTYLPFIGVPLGPPDFEIISPLSGWRVGGMLYFAAQAHYPNAVSSMTFQAGSTPLGTDSTPADGFKVFFDASQFPAGALTLTAVAHGNGEPIVKTITVNVVSSPPAQGTLGAEGGVLASARGSVLTIPPGALPNPASVRVDEMTQAEVTAQNGIDWESIGVTFLGQQHIESDTAFDRPYLLASAAYGNRVQPGQAVVQYQLVPDVDGDGADELVVVNTASVAPNNAVISDPIPPVLVEAPSAMQAGAAGSRLTSVGGPPGDTVQFFVSGFNPLSLGGNQSEWTCADGARLSAPGTITANPANPQGQIFSTVIPHCSPGPALVSLKNLSTGSTAGGFVVLVTAAPPLGGPPGTGTLDFMDATGELIESLPDDLGGANLPLGLPSTWKTDMQNDLEDARDAIADRMADPDPDQQQDLSDSDDLLPYPEDDFPSPAPGSDCLTDEAKAALEEQVNHYLVVASAWRIQGEAGLADYYMPLAQRLFQLAQLPTCDDDDDPGGDPGDGDNEGAGGPACEPTRPAGNGGSSDAGMGSVLASGGSGCGGAGTPSNQMGQGLALPSRLGQAEAGLVVKLYSAGSPLPFTGVADPGGYFFIPILPAGEPFTATAYNLSTNTTRTIAGIGPEVGDSVFMYFDFFTEQPATATVYWDGGGDGISWHDPLNWHPDGVPGPTQHVIIDVPGDITVVHSNVGLDAIFSLHSAEALVLADGTLDITGPSVLSRTLTLAGGMLSGTGDVTVGGLLTWSAGIMAGSGTTIANGGLSFNGSNNRGRYLFGRTLQNIGTAVFQEGLLNAYGDAVIVNQPGAMFDFQGDVSLYVSTTGATFNNLGTVLKSAGSGTAVVYTSFNNSGTVAVQSGGLSLNGGGTHSGAFQGGGTLLLAGGSHSLTGQLMNLDVSVMGGALTVNGVYAAGTTTLTGGTLTVATGLIADTDRMNLSGGILTGDGDVAVSGPLTWAGGTMSGAGTTYANGGLTLSGNHGRTLNGRMLANAGSAAFQAGNLQASNGAVIVNRSGATFDFQADATLYLISGAATFDNQGTVIKSAGTGTLAIGPAFVNAGSVAVQSGQLQFGGGFTQTVSGVLHVRLGGPLPITNYDQYTCLGNAVLGGTLDVTLVNGFLPNPGDSFFVMAFTTHAGQFATVTGHGQAYTTNYSSANLTLVAP